MTLLLRPDTLTEAITKYIRDAIVRGVYPPGARLPEVALANELNTSRGTVREALRSLSDGGLVEVVPHRGAFVSQLSVRATWEITSMRALLEPYASRLALEASGSGAELQAEVHAAFEALREAIATTDPVAVADADVAFHRAVFARCGHGMLLGQLETLQVLSRRVVLTNQLYAADAPTLIGQHAPIVAAVDARDPARVEAEVRAHVIEAGELLLTRMAALEPVEPAAQEAEPFGSWPTGARPSARRPTSP
ncbi:MAG TPA: GntR family transcriptional regulator [Candidatus Limnocylindrales bacterium]|nr:GntR family transcriptional regulator [Candidatus Limnocylindrales bacterium]